MKGRPPGLIRLMVAVAASAATLALLAAAGVPSSHPGIVCGSAGSLAISAVILMAGDRRDPASAVLSVACGVAVGWPLVADACSPVGVFLGPVAGLAVRRVTRPRGRGPGEPHARIGRMTSPETSVSR